MSSMWSVILSTSMDTHWGFCRCWCRSRYCRHHRPPDSRRSLWSEGWGRASYRQSRTHNRAPGNRGGSFKLQHSHIQVAFREGNGGLWKKEKMIANYVDNLLIISVIFQAKNVRLFSGSIFCVRIFFFLSYLIVNSKSLGFGLLVGQKKLFESVTLGSGKFGWALLVICWHFTDKTIGRKYLRFSRYLYFT